MRRLILRMHAARDTAVAVVCALGLAVVVLVIPEVADEAPRAQVAQR